MRMCGNAEESVTLVYRVVHKVLGYFEDDAATSKLPHECQVPNMKGERHTASADPHVRAYNESSECTVR